VDTANGDDDFTPFRNIMNEWYLKDLSRKLRSSQRVKSSQGYAIGQPPFGYKYGTENKKRWIIDEPAAETVRLMFQLRLQNNSVNDMAKILKARRVLIPSAYLAQSGIRAPKRISEHGDYFWSSGMVRQVLVNRSYVGDVVNFRTYSKSFKLKKRFDNPEENWEIHENVHDAIVSREDWLVVQSSFGQSKIRKPKHTERNMFSGLLECSDCGANLNYKFTHDNPENLCATTHHIRVDKLTELVEHHLRNILHFAHAFEDKFVKIVVDERYREVCANQRKNQKELAEANARNRELDRLYEKIYEDQALGKLPEERFLMLAAKYDEEQAALKQRIRHLKKIVAQEQANEMNLDGFLALVRRHTADFNELTPDMTQEFIDKIVVHHRQKEQGVMQQRVEIYYKMIGHVNVPNFGEKQTERLQVSFGRKRDVLAVAA